MSIGKSQRIMKRVAGSEVLPARLAWFGLAAATNASFADALETTSTPVRWLCAIALWSIWTAVVVATFVPRTVSLTVLRIAAPAALVATVIAAVRGDTSVGDVVAVSYVAVTVAIVFAPITGAAFVNGSSYGDEVRVPLRVPAHLLFGPVELAWLAVVAGVSAGPLLLAARVWLLGIVATAAGGVAAWYGARALHGLARRWLVIVPAGVVVHDPLTLADPILLRRSNTRNLGPAPATALDEGATDLTANALGLALEARLAEPVEVALVRPGKGSEFVTTDRVLFTPTRPGALLKRLARSPG